MQIHIVRLFLSRLARQHCIAGFSVGVRIDVTVPVLQLSIEKPLKELIAARDGQYSFENAPSS